MPFVLIAVISTVVIVGRLDYQHHFVAELITITMSTFIFVVRQLVIY